MKAIPTVHELRKSGLKVKLSHHRKFFRYDPFTGKKHEVVVPWHLKEVEFKDYFLDARGGETHVIITDPNKTEEGLTGVSVCSNDDHFCRKDGIKKAIARALGSKR